MKGDINLHCTRWYCLATYMTRGTSRQTHRQLLGSTYMPELEIGPEGGRTTTESVPKVAAVQALLVRSVSTKKDPSWCEDEHPEG